MIAPPRQPDEPLRLAALHALEILDTPPEERFDRITRLARRIFDVPIALVSLVDADRQWFKSADGFVCEQTPRSTSFCGHTILEPELLVVPDALQDERFRDNPMVTGEPRVRFYVGCPLTIPGGLNLGALCLMDHQPRMFGDEDRENLRDLARLVVRELVAFELATTDELTGCFNRRAFKNMAVHVLEVCRRTGAGATLAYFDLNGFKQINDSYGHAEGDRALVEFVNALRAGIRSTDLVGRLGGDEFAALFVGTREGKDANIIERLRDKLCGPHTEGLRPYPLRFAVGEVSFDPERHFSVSQIFEEADAIMYRQKQAAKAVRRISEQETTL
jgi:diguanylate cyclase (GGDEF)-like protein